MYSNWGLAINSAGDIFIDNTATDTTGQFAIEELNPATGVFTTFASSATNPELTVPYHMAFGANGDLYVTTTGGNGIQVYSPTGALISNGLGQTAFNTHNATGVITGLGIAIQPGTGNIFVSDIANASVLEYTSAGVFIGRISGTPNVNSPYALAFDSFGELYVVNDGSDTVAKFNPTTLTFDGDFTTVAANGAGNIGPLGIIFASAVTPEPSTGPVLMIGIGLLLGVQCFRRTRKPLGS